jgi:hypothetical protein
VTRHKERVHAPFGSIDMDTLAQAIYVAFHDYQLTNQGGPWRKYKKERGDIVVEYFRCAAEAAMDEYEAQNPYYSSDPS